MRSRPHVMEIYGIEGEKPARGPPRRDNQQQGVTSPFIISVTIPVRFLLNTKMYKGENPKEPKSLVNILT